MYIFRELKIRSYSTLKSIDNYSAPPLICRRSKVITHAYIKITCPPDCRGLLKISGCWNAETAIWLEAGYLGYRTFMTENGRKIPQL